MRVKLKKSLNEPNVLIAHRRKRRQEMIEQEIAGKLRKIDEPGKLVEENFRHVTQSQPMQLEAAVDIDPETSETVEDQKQRDAS